MALASEFSTRTKFSVGDATIYSSTNKFDAGICCFVLEHLERPIDLLINLHKNTKPSSYSFITAALTAGEIDHIYEFKRESELVRLSEEAGFRVIKTFSSAPTTRTYSNKFLPRSMGLIIQKRNNDLY